MKINILLLRNLNHFTFDFNFFILIQTKIKNVQRSIDGENCKQIQQISVTEWMSERVSDKASYPKALHLVKENI